MPLAPALASSSSTSACRVDSGCSQRLDPSTIARGGRTSSSSVSRIAAGRSPAAASRRGSARARTRRRRGSRPGRSARGTATRSKLGMPVTAATQPWSSTTRPGPGQPRQQRRRDPAQRLQPALVLPPQAGLGELHRGADEGDGGGVHGLGGPADVDHAEHLAGARVVDGAGGARPDVVGAHEVLGGEHLHGRALGQRGADRVAADHAFRPVGALGEAQRVGAVADRGGALPPEQHPVGVGDDHDVPRVLGHRRQRGTEFGQHALQRGAHPPLLDLVVGQRAGRVTEVGIDALSPRPHPGARDEPPRIGGRTVAGEQGVVDAREHPRVPDDVRARPDRADRLVHPHHPEPPA